MNRNRNLKVEMKLQRFAGGGTAEAGLTTGDSFTAVQAREIDFVTQFTEMWKRWFDIMKIIKPVAKEPGTEIVTYVAAVDGEMPEQVGPGEKVKLTKIKLKRSSHRVMKIEKFRKAVPVEDVAKYGAQVAVSKTDKAFRNKLFRDTLKEFYDFLLTGKLIGSAKTWQRALSSSLYGLRNYLEKQDLDFNGIVGFANLMDYEEYVGEKEITLQTVNGINYIQGFLGYDVLWLLPDNYIPRNKVISTTMENIIMYYTNPASADIKALGLDLTVDPELGLIGFHTNGDYTTFTGETQALKDIVLWADRLDAICVMTVNAKGEYSEPTYTPPVEEAEGSDS